MVVAGEGSRAGAGSGRFKKGRGERIPKGNTSGAPTPLTPTPYCKAASGMGPREALGLVLPDWGSGRGPGPGLRP